MPGTKHLTTRRFPPPDRQLNEACHLVELSTHYRLSICYRCCCTQSTLRASAC